MNDPNPLNYRENQHTTGSMLKIFTRSTESQSF
ncbi:MAG: hypothetical protein CM15mV149_200 [uncultured marine virus]|nr:MAG: hypothetical protein CM15mV149_200 [uncultured marine virus]